MDRDLFLKLMQKSRAKMEQRLAAEGGNSKEAVERREKALRAFDEKTALMAESFPKITMWSDFVRKPPVWSD